jgi:hypothetical protein
MTTQTITKTTPPEWLLAFWKDIDDKTFGKEFNLMARSPVFLVQKLLPLMNRGGSIILVSSAMHVMGIANHTTYAATKRPCAPTRVHVAAACEPLVRFSDDRYTFANVHYKCSRICIGFRKSESKIEVYL